ncbi:asparagine synthase-related protein [Amycolatopsis sp. NPDC051102]|uniref:asparagine synthase-related protein n=1 Tax=Amycolatopsis sp. NPDC051102 TaxID=3155163 RepID=UPI00342562F1
MITTVVSRGDRGFAWTGDRLEIASTDAETGLAEAAGKTITLAFHGYLECGGGTVLSGPAAAERLAAAFLDRGETFLDQVVGGYSLLLADRRTGRTYVARDAGGLGSLFVAREADRTAVGTEPAEVASAAGADRPSLPGFAQYLLLNYTLADSWFLDGVRPVPAGALYLIDAGELRRLRGTPGFPGRGDENLPPPRTGELAAALAAASSALGGDSVAVHLSGGVDTSLIVHALPRARKVRTYTAFYQDDDADRAWAAEVAREIGADHREFRIPADESFLDVVESLVGALGAPVMAIGVPTFWYLGRAAAAAGSPVVLSGVAADHPLVGWNRIDRMGAAAADPRDLAARCTVHVPPEVLAPYLADAGLRAAVAEVSERLRELMPHGDPPARSIERFHAEHFLPEHLRSASVAHGGHGVRVRHPFLSPSVSGLGFRAARSREEALGKRYLRRELHALGCWAAIRAGKQQQALSFTGFRALARDRLLDRLAAGPGLFGLDTARLSRLAASDEPADPRELRLLWLAYSYLCWQERQRGRVPALRR